MSFKVKNFRDMERTLINGGDELPAFDQMTREEEAEFWETHDFAEGVFEEGPEIDAEVYEALGIEDPKTKK